MNSDQNTTQPGAESQDTAAAAVNMAESSSDTIDCLPIPPPYTSEPPAQLAPNTRQCRSLSTEHIMDYDDIETQRSKVCCDAMLCKYCLAGCFKFKRVLFMLSTAGALSITGAVVLGATRTAENNFLTLSLMFAGLGMVLITVVLLGWRCTPSDHEPCHLLFGLGSYSMVPQMPLFGRRTRRSSRFFWLGDRLFPEFRYRRPPPTYSLSMQEFNQPPSCFRPTGTVPKTPPPAYKLYNSQRNRARKGVHIIYPTLPTDPHCLPPLYRERVGYQSSRHLTNICSAHSSQLAGADNQAFSNDTNTGISSECAQTSQVAKVEFISNETEDLSAENRQSMTAEGLTDNHREQFVSPDNHNNANNTKAKQPKRKRSHTATNFNTDELNETARVELSEPLQAGQPTVINFYDSLGDVTHL